jgi:hypothetical protein
MLFDIGSRESWGNVIEGRMPDAYKGYKGAGKGSKGAFAKPAALTGPAAGLGVGVRPVPPSGPPPPSEALPKPPLTYCGKAPSGSAPVQRVILNTKGHIGVAVGKAAAFKGSSGSSGIIIGARNPPVPIPKGPPAQARGPPAQAMLPAPDNADSDGDLGMGASEASLVDLLENSWRKAQCIATSSEIIRWLGWLAMASQCCACALQHVCVCASLVEHILYHVAFVIRAIDKCRKCASHTCLDLFKKYIMFDNLHY